MLEDFGAFLKRGEQQGRLLPLHNRKITARLKCVQETPVPHDSVQNKIKW